MIRRQRWLRNKKDSHDKDTQYNYERFGVNYGINMCFRNPMYPNPIKPSQLLYGHRSFYNVEILLDPFYKVEELQTLKLFVNRKKVYKKDFTTDQIVFTPQILVYMIFMSEDDIFERYILHWKQYQCVPLKVPTELITPDLRPGCSCSECFGRCVRIANHYQLLPDLINHELMSLERNKMSHLKI